MLGKIVLMILAHDSMDPTEIGVTWKALNAEGYEVVFATPDGNPAVADHRMVTGDDLGIFKYIMRADVNGRAAYAELSADRYFKQPLSYAGLADYKLDDFDGLVLPGGHDKQMRVYIESPEVQRLIAAFFDANKPVGAICHGVTVVARSLSAKTGKSVLYGRKTTSLTNSYELFAWGVTRAWLGDYFRTYPVTVEDEVRSVLRDPKDFVDSAFTLVRDSPSHPEHGFVVRDRNYVSSRWPGDAHRFAAEFLRVLREQRPQARLLIAP